MSFDSHTPSYFVNPAYRPALGPVHRVVDPATLEPVGSYANSRPADVEGRLDAVTRAQRAWMRCDAKSRAKALHALPFRRSKMVVIDHKLSIHGWWYPYPDEWFYEAGGRKL